MFFHRLCDKYIEIIRSAKLPTEPMAIFEISTSFRDHMNELIRDIDFNCVPVINRKKSSAHSVGLNSVGLLLDRLTILCIRFVKHSDLLDPIEDQKIVEILHALNVSSPGLSSVNTKVTIHESRVSPNSFSDAALGLLLTNTLLWEAQEVLYMRGADSLPESELRAYITFFAAENINRNQYIQFTEMLYWKQFE